MEGNGKHYSVLSAYYIRFLEPNALVNFSGVSMKRIPLGLIALVTSCGLYIFTCTAQSKLLVSINQPAPSSKGISTVSSALASLGKKTSRKCPSVK